jgi:manganese oxidase
MTSTVTDRPTRSPAPGRTWWLSALLAGAGVAWLGVVQGNHGSASSGGRPMLVEWAAQAAIALPWVMATTFVSARARRPRAGDDERGPDTRAVTAARTAAAAAVVVALTVRGSDWLLSGRAPAPSLLITDVLVLLALLLPMAWIAPAVGGRSGPLARRLAALRPGRRAVVLPTGLALVAAGLTNVAVLAPAAQAQTACARTITANVVAIDQPLVYNRHGTVNPNGMIFALRRDVVPVSGSTLAAGNARLRPDKRPRPLTLRANVGDCLRIEFQNLLSPTALGDQPATREAGVHVSGMQLVTSINDDGSFVADNPNAGAGRKGSLVAPGGTGTFSYHAEREGAYVLSSTADNVSGEALTGTTAFGLFGAVNVQPAGSTWHRSQLTRAEMDLVTTGTTGTGQPKLDYSRTYPTGPRAGLPVLTMLHNNEIIHSDLNAIISGFPSTYRQNATNPNRNQPFRELTVVFHDEIKVVQAYPQFNSAQFAHTLHGVSDNMAINYGASGAGAEILANRQGVGPAADCAECKGEEFFLTSWAVGDPALLVDVPANRGKATRALYPDDPANVFHSYLNDQVKVRNLHVGKEHHVFHLHAHQWLETPDDDNSSYKDSQAIGPGASHTYEISHGGSGNRNKTAGDSIMHCHFYPHFAQGMWALWRVHDTFEQGTALDAAGRAAAGSRALPDGEIVTGTPIPGVVPIPTLPMAPMPAAGVTIVQEAGLPGGQVQLPAAAATTNVGFPFWVPGKAGHRAPTAPLDIIDNGGLPRHLVTGGSATGALTPYDFSKRLRTARAVFLPEDGTPAEKRAMAFHSQRYWPTSRPDGTSGQFETNGLPAVRGAPFAEPCRNDNGTGRAVNRRYQGANIQLDLQHNKAGWHFPQSRIISLWQDVAPTLAGTRTPEPLVMRANSGDCVEYQHTNLTPHEYEQDAFQVKTPTDIIGQHIHLVKFDVTASDGAANGFNYEDGTFAPAEVRERIEALHEPTSTCSGLVTDCKTLTAKPHPFFGAGPNGAYLGARTTVQRWWVDPVLNNAGVDRGLGNVFTHDHFAPSTHQQVGLYGALLVEPAGSKWRNPETGGEYGTRSDGGPTSWRADILPPNSADATREFFLAVQDFQLSYQAGRGGTTTTPIPDPEGAVNPPSKEEVDDRRLFKILKAGDNCPGAAHKVGTRGCPEAIAANDPGTFSVNYRNEPLALRLRNPATNKQADGQAGDPALAYSSRVTRADAALNRAGPYPPLSAGVQAQDPFTPLLRMYDNDRVNLRVVVGAHEEGHIGTVHGVKWRDQPASPNSGWRNATMFGISEQVQFETPIAPRFQGQTRATTDYLWSLDSSTDGAWNGAWGVARAHSASQSNLLTLPNNPVTNRGVSISNLSSFTGPCPGTAPVTRANVTAVLARDVLPGGTLTYNDRDPNDPLHDPTAILYVRTEDLDPATGRLKAGVPVEPLILRARAGDCIDVTVANKLPASVPDTDGFNALPPIVDGFNANDIRPSSQVGFRPQLVTYITSKDEGANVGLNGADQTVPPGGSRTYRWYAGDLRLSSGSAVATPMEFGATNLISADPLKHGSKGAIGALIIEPQGSTWTEDPTRRASATVRNAAGATLFREHVMVLSDDLNLRRGTGAGSALPFIAGMEDPEDSGMSAVNYRTEPLWLRKGIPPTESPTQTRTRQLADVLSNGLVGGDPKTPVFTSPAGTPTRLRVLQPAGHPRNHVIDVHGHSWQRTPYVNGSNALGDNPLSVHKGAQEGMGPANHFDLLLQGGAGGKFRVKGDYLIRDMTAGHFYNGTWAVLRVN